MNINEIKEKNKKNSYMKIERFNKSKCDFCNKQKLIYAKYKKFMSSFDVCENCFNLIKEFQNEQQQKKNKFLVFLKKFNFCLNIFLIFGVYVICFPIGIIYQITFLIIKVIEIGNNKIEKIHRQID